jgi:DnaJ-class molecular chaperone
MLKVKNNKNSLANLRRKFEVECRRCYGWGYVIVMGTDKRLECPECKGVGKLKFGSDK